MREHPIPTDVVGYKFHIVGNMTLKQFAFIAVGVIIGVIIYSTNLIGIIKWTLIILSAGFGVMVAFVPIEERPLDHWISVFFKRIYSPTKFYWKKETSIPFAFTHKKRQETKEEEEAVNIDLSPARRQRIKEYLSSVNNPKKINQMDSAEQIRMQEILSMYEEVEVDKVKSTPQKVKPNLTPKVRNLAKKENLKKSNRENIVFQQQQQQTLKVKNKRKLTPEQPINNKESLNIATPAVAVEKSNQQSYVVPDKKVDTSNSLPFPKQPDKPNVLVGMVLTTNNKLVDQATIQIKNTQGKVIHALKTNLLGQFSISTALPNGSYIVSVQKQNLSFEEKTISLSGKIVEPLELRST
ncbi:MAG: hypothetical protein HN981_02590 [Candidatus Pacebacteria bacterium]|jgi:hypothetical protein|nr:hypothetical protein [Candidatus Paceibacterota bacterium]MBT4652621.1 hypothetical protein [Candidatus Paceibacterota bacterium]MBT6756448.1 hypothetical protein [Candidatus Paceibacterota bacterium]MBT6921258.1 hypothetical protein [Candidatus Paceibacterota bacterium]